MYYFEILVILHFVLNLFAKDEIKTVAMLLWGSIAAQKMLTVPTFSIIVNLISASLLDARKAVKRQYDVMMSIVENFKTLIAFAGKL